VINVTIVLPLRRASFGPLQYPPNGIGTYRLRCTDFHHSEWHCRPLAGFARSTFHGIAVSRGDSRPSTVNPYSYDTAVLTIFPEYIEFDGEDVLQLAVKKEPRKSTE